jgi:GTPase-associated protein 1, N-terminal domain type 1
VASSLVPVEVQQCVFGYDDGHRLLATSKQLSPGDFSRLLLASDLAPGLPSIEHLAYWTGIPLADEQHYALLRTWAAPEISRPGCVWTHVLRIPFAEMARFADLGILRQMARRPVLGASLEAYRKTISAVPERAESVDKLTGEDARRAALALLRLAYGGAGGPQQPLPMTDDALFALWSQQWPRLRRHFSFRTSVSPSGSPRELSFDLQILADVFRILSGSPPSLEGGTPSDWELVAVDDLFASQPSELRRFLWRYGSDVHRVFESFKVLTRLFMATRVDRLEGGKYREILLTVANAFPDPGDARLLKADLVALTRNPYSRIPDIDPLGSWEFLMEQASMEQWPAPALPTDDGLSQELQSRPEVVVRIAEKALNNTSPAARYFLNMFANGLTPELFWSVAAGDRRLMVAAATVHPELLDHQELGRLSSTDLLALLSSCSFDSGLAERIVGRLIRINDPAAAELMWDKHSEVVVGALIDAAPSSGASDAWINVVAMHPQQWLRADVLSRAMKSRAIGKIVERLDPESPSIIAAGARPWAEALRAVNNVKDQLGLLTFVLVLALTIAEPDSEYLFERAFLPVYEGIERRRIPTHMFDALARTFPDVPSWKEWDSCYRLTLAVAKTYVERRTNPDKLAATIADRLIRRRIVKLVGSLKQGDQIYDDSDYSE